MAALVLNRNWYIHQEYDECMLSFFFSFFFLAFFPVVWLVLNVLRHCDESVVFLDEFVSEIILIYMTIHGFLYPVEGAIFDPVEAFVCVEHVYHVVYIPFFLSFCFGRNINQIVCIFCMVTVSGFKKGEGDTHVLSGGLMDCICPIAFSP